MAREVVLISLVLAGSLSPLTRALHHDLWDTLDALDGVTAAQFGESDLALGSLPDYCPRNEISFADILPASTLATDPEEGKFMKVTMGRAPAPDGRVIVRVKGYRDMSDLKEAIEAALGPPVPSHAPLGPGNWSLEERAAEAWEYPTDFAVIRVADDEIDRVGDVLRAKLPDFRDIHADTRYSRTIQWLSEDSDGERTLIALSQSNKTRQLYDSLHCLSQD